MQRQSVPGPTPGTYSRRAFLRLSAGAAAGALVAACQPGPVTRTITGARAAETVVELVYQDWRTDWFPPMAQEMLARFHERHPTIRVFYLPDPENLETKMLADMQAGTAPDVFQGCCAHYPIWAQKGGMLDLRPYVSRDLSQQTIQDWDPAQYRYYFTPDGQQYGLPKYHGAMALYYNKDMFDACDEPYPTREWTYDDYAAAMGRLCDSAPERYRPVWGSLTEISWDRLQVHVNAWGGHFVDPADARRCLMAEPPALDAIEWLRALMWDDHVMATPMDVSHMGTSRAFVAQRVAMVEDGSWALKDILSGADFAVGVAPLPKGPARRATLATTDGFSIYSRCKHPDAAWELMQFLIGEEYGRAMARAHFLQPARYSLVTDWVACIRDEFPAQAVGMDIAAFADGHREGYSVTTEFFADMSAAKPIADAAWDQILSLGQAPVERMIQACQQIAAAQASEG